MKTSPKQISLFTGEELTSLQEGSHVNRSAWPESEKERRMNAICGPKCLESYGKFNHATLWAKTFPELLIGMEGWFSNKCRLTWKLKGTKFRRTYFQLAVSTLHTDGTGYGLLPTPKACEIDETPEQWEKRRRNPNAKMMGPSLTVVAKLLPTPQLMLLKTPSAMDAYSENLSKKEQKFGNSGTLAQEIQTGFVYQRGLLPTLTCQDSKQKENSPSQLHKVQELAICVAGGSGSQLNPRFVAEMMGFPPSWLELPFQSTATNQSRHTETR